MGKPKVEENNRGGFNIIGSESIAFAPPIRVFIYIVSNVAIRTNFARGRSIFPMRDALGVAGRGPIFIPTLCPRA